MYYETDNLSHYGVGHLNGGHSGRYPWGSGKDRYNKFVGENAAAISKAKSSTAKVIGSVSTIKYGAKAAAIIGTSAVTAAIGPAGLSAPLAAATVIALADVGKDFAIAKLKKWAYTPVRKPEGTPEEEEKMRETLRKQDAEGNYYQHIIDNRATLAKKAKENDIYDLTFLECCPQEISENAESMYKEYEKFLEDPEKWMTEN